VRILAFAYACEPGKGSEPGAGWGLARMLSEVGETWVLTRANNRAAIDASFPSLAERHRLRFVYVDLPRWTRWWKRGQRGVRLYYLLWLLAALRRARKLQREVGFNLVWHLTFANAWLGTTACLLGSRFVYGPVGGGVPVPWRLVPALGLRGALYEVARAWARAAGRYLNPFARLAWRRADVILVQNPATREWLPSRHRHKATVFPNTLAVQMAHVKPQAPRAPGDRPPTALYAGRLLPWKGLSLALRALARLPEWRFIVLGSGPDERRLRRLVRRLGLEGRVEFGGWCRREDVLRAMKQDADVLLFPSLHDEASLAVVEALTADLPVVCLDHGGPPVGARSVGGVQVTSAMPMEIAALVEALRETCPVSAVLFVPGDGIPYRSVKPLVEAVDRALSGIEPPVAGSR